MHTNAYRSMCMYVYALVIACLPILGMLTNDSNSSYINVCVFEMPLLYTYVRNEE